MWRALRIIPGACSRLLVLLLPSWSWTLWLQQSPLHMPELLQGTLQDTQASNSGVMLLAAVSRRWPGGGVKTCTCGQFGSLVEAAGRNSWESCITEGVLHHWGQGRFCISGRKVPFLWRDGGFQQFERENHALHVSCYQLNKIADFASTSHQILVVYKLQLKRRG